MAIVGGGSFCSHYQWVLQLEWISACCAFLPPDRVATYMLPAREASLPLLALGLYPGVRKLLSSTN